LILLSLFEHRGKDEASDMTASKNNVLAFKPLRKRFMDKKKAEKAEKFDKPERNETLIKRTIELPAYVWEALAEEARAEDRTLKAQLKVALIERYRMKEKNSLSGVHWLDRNQQQNLAERAVALD
jgi:macrodomain Ter protein organizer (MatP/YcbG family)